MTGELAGDATSLSYTRTFKPLRPLTTYFQRPQELHTRSLPLSFFHSFSPIMVSASILLTALSAVHLTTARAVLRERATTLVGTLYGYGANITGLPLFYGDGIAYLGDQPPVDIAAVSNMTCKRRSLVRCEDHADHFSLPHFERRHGSDTIPDLACQAGRDKPLHRSGDWRFCFRWLHQPVQYVCHDDRL